MYKLILCCLLTISLIGCKENPKKGETEKWTKAASTGIALAQHDTSNAISELQKIDKMPKVSTEVKTLVHGVVGTLQDSAVSMAIADNEFSLSKKASLEALELKDKTVSDLKEDIAKLKSKTTQGLDKLIILGLFAGPIGIALLFYPGTNLVGRGIAVAGFVMTGASVITKSSEGPLLYFTYGVVGIGLLWLLWKLYLEVKASKELKKTGDLFLQNIPESKRETVLKEVSSDGGGIQSKSTEKIVDRYEESPSVTN